VDCGCVHVISHSIYNRTKIQNHRLLVQLYNPVEKLEIVLHSLVELEQSTLNHIMSGKQGIKYVKHNKARLKDIKYHNKLVYSTILFSSY
jgi:hypothetical protein